MDDAKNRRAVTKALNDALAKDRSRTFVVEISPLGLVQMTRQNISDGVRDIPIEERDAAEVIRMTGRTADNRLATVEITAPGARVANYGFDVTPARLVTGLITERGVAAASEAGLRALYPEIRGSAGAASRA